MTGLIFDSRVDGPDRQTKDDGVELGKDFVIRVPINRDLARYRNEQDGCIVRLVQLSLLYG